jgi:hypothetical protein
MGAAVRQPLCRDTLSDRVEDSVIAQLPLLPGAFETSLWLRRRDA